MKKFLLRSFLLLAAVCSLATAAFAGGWEPQTVLPAEGYCLTKEVVYERGELLSQASYFYQFDQNGFLTALKEISSDSEIALTSKYTYDSNGNCVKEELIGTPQAGESYIIATALYTYDKDGNLVSSEYDGTHTVFTYDSDGLLVKAEATYSDGENDHTIVIEYTYDANGYLIAESDTSDGVEQWRYQYTNNASGNPTVCNEYMFDSEAEEDDQWVLITRQNYTYDAAGNNIKLEAFTQEDGEFVLYRTYEYTYKKLGEQITVSPFVDVKDTAANAWFYEPVLWAVNNGITTGMTQTEFMPDNTCTREQAVTFLWRAAGEPEPSKTTTPFVDVVKGSYYEKAVQWAYETGITTGVDATHFDPGGQVSRGQFVTFLWRLEGKPSASGKQSFSDVVSGQYYYNAVLWATEQKITDGMGGGKFEPNTICTRAQVVTFLYRALAV